MGDNGKENGSYYTGLYRGYIGDNGKENGNYRDYIGVILGLYRGYIGIMEKKMETIGIMGVIQGLRG